MRRTPQIDGQYQKVFCHSITSLDQSRTSLFWQLIDRNSDVDNWDAYWRRFTALDAYHDIALHECNWRRLFSSARSWRLPNVSSPRRIIRMIVPNDWAEHAPNPKGEFSNTNSARAEWTTRHGVFVEGSPEIGSLCFLNSSICPRHCVQGLHVLQCTARKGIRTRLCLCGLIRIDDMLNVCHSLFLLCNE